MTKRKITNFEILYLLFIVTVLLVVLFVGIYTTVGFFVKIIFKPDTQPLGVQYESKLRKFCDSGCGFGVDCIERRGGIVVCYCSVIREENNTCVVDFKNPIKQVFCYGNRCWEPT
ncbi:MAG: hypothetical protein B6U95_09070 [Thermofilum sp. ex4484_82]|nr:MAG: hypothetical protein B6U95_09070 [Thermofilum sp. ex4484_82]OYT35999.1 MAG: hypothetical protein B6U96_09075 [Archaeoglobales archaeon ex4484_92]